MKNVFFLPRKYNLNLLYLLLFVFLSAGFIGDGIPTAADKVETLEIGAKAPDFRLEGIDDAFYTLDSFASSKLLLVVFTCNHCPTAQAYEDRLIELQDEYGPKGVALVAISPNDPTSVRLDEMGYTDLNDSLEEMKISALRTRDLIFLICMTGIHRKLQRPMEPSPRPMLIFLMGIECSGMLGASTTMKKSGMQRSTM